VERFAKPDVELRDAEVSKRNLAFFAQWPADHIIFAQGDLDHTPLCPEAELRASFAGILMKVGPTIVAAIW